MCATRSHRVAGAAAWTDPRPAPAASTTHHIRDRQTAAYPGDFSGTSTVLYEPIQDSSPDPGEIVWTHMVFEEDYQRGKDRPVLVIGRDEPWLHALMLTSKDHDRDAAVEARHGRVWPDVGTGSWDSRRRPSEIRIDLVAAQVRSVDGWT